MTRSLRPDICIILLAVTAASCAPADSDRATRLRRSYLEIVSAEDARASSGTALRVLTTYGTSNERFLRRAAIRGLGRLEDPGHAGYIERALSDPAPEVRATAAWALAQAYVRVDGAPAVNPIVARIAIERDSTVRAALAESLGRLTLDAAQARRAAAALVEMSYGESGQDASGPVMEGVAIGLDALVRSSGGAIVTGSVSRRLEDLRLYEDGIRGRDHQHRVRAIAISALARAGLIDQQRIRLALRDESPIVRAAAARVIGTLDPAWHSEALRMTMFSQSYHAQIEGVRFILGQPRSEAMCSYLMEGARVPPPGVTVPVGLRVLAIDGLSQPCPDLGAQRDLLSRAAAPEEIDSVNWQPAAHALVALAAIDPSMATERLAAYAEHENPFVRGYAARAATLSGAGEALRMLLGDPVPNVRTEALRGLVRLEGRGADRAAIEQLQSGDPQLVMTAANALADTDLPEAGEALVESLERFSSTRRETFRDARRALLERLHQLGDERFTERLTPYLSDFDALVAADVAELLESWNGRPFFPTPLAPARLALPTIEDLDEMASSTVVLHMRGLGEVHIELHPFVSTTNTWRFFRQARDGYFDGLTFHRWSPNFVIQGGSPNANEYFGDGPFSRDEVGMHHWRGTVGISTRGHDTGDGQIFVNLLDNTRLDHQYTIVGTVVAGLDVVDRVNEGSVIERAEVRATP